MLKGKRVMIYIWSGAGVAGKAEGQLQRVGRGSPPHRYFVCTIAVVWISQCPQHQLWSWSPAHRWWLLL